MFFWLFLLPPLVHHPAIFSLSWLVGHWLTGCGLKSWDFSRQRYWPFVQPKLGLPLYPNTFCLFIYMPSRSYLLVNEISLFVMQIAKRREKLLNYMLFLRITPTLPNTFINVASPIVDIPFHIFFLATMIGLIPASYITVRVSFICTCTHPFLIYYLL